MRAINQWEKKQGSLTYTMDRENEVSKIFIIIISEDEYSPRN